jgi:hypothetical protein
MALLRTSIATAIAFVAIVMLPSAGQAIPVTFDNLQGKVLGNAINTPGPGVSTDVNYEILNNTGVTWTDFEFGVGSPAGGNVIFGKTASGTDPYGGPGTAALLNNTSLRVVNLNIADQATYSLRLSLYFAEAPFALVGGAPSIEAPPTPTPEPATLALLGLGVLALAKLRARAEA